MNASQMQNCLYGKLTNCSKMDISFKNYVLEKLTSVIETDNSCYHWLKTEWPFPPENDPEIDHFKELATISCDLTWQLRDLKDQNCEVDKIYRNKLTKHFLSHHSVSK